MRKVKLPAVISKEEIGKKLMDFEEAEKIAAKSRLGKTDVENVSDKVNSATAKHAQKLFDESNR